LRPFGRFFPGQVPWVSLSAYQQSLLNGMDRALEARDPRLASKFALFARLTRDDGPPRTERLAPRPGLMQRLLSVPGHVAKASATIPILLVAGLMAAIITLGIVTSRGTVCPPSVTKAQHFAQMRSAACQSSAHGLHK
jgi:hypothetical protein